MMRTTTQRLSTAGIGIALRRMTRNSISMILLVRERTDSGISLPGYERSVDRKYWA